MTKLQRAFRLYNRKYFDNELPQDAKVVWEKMPATVLGYYRHSENKIAINRLLGDASCLWRLTLLHEMVHMDRPRASHGPIFQKRMRELAKAGAFDYLW